MKVYEIALSPQPQTFLLSLFGVQYRLTLRYAKAQDGGWILDIADSAGSPLACGLPLVTGADLLAQLAYLNIGGSLYVATDGDLDAVPTFANLGKGTHLYFVTP